jgi:hypothetical protein
MRNTFFILLGLIIIIGFGCSDKSTRPTAAIPSNGCTSCHSDINMLKVTADPVPPDTSQNGSGET